MMSGFRRLASRYRRQFSALVLVAGSLVVGRQLYALVPHTTEVVIDLGPRHAEVVELRLHYLAGGEPLRSVRYAHPEGAPERVHDQLRSQPGTLELESLLVLRDGSSRAHALRFAAGQERSITLHAEP